MTARTAITAEPLSLDAHVSQVSDSRHGAISTFVGTVRDHDPSVSGRVTHLEYSAHPDAEDILARITAELCAEGEVAASVSHRIGLLDVGEAAIIAAVGAPHRAEAFETCRALVERIKAELPVWKREVLADGSHTWVGIA